MSKRIPGQLRQRRVEVVCGIIWFSLVLVFVYVTWALISERVGSENAGVVRLMYVAFIGFPGLVTLIGASEQSVVLPMRVILMSVQILIVWLVFDLLGGDSAAFQLGAKGPQPGLVSTYEVFFIYLLSLVCVVFQSWLIAYERHQNELTAVVGGVLVIIGILMPKLLESYSILRAYCSEGGCASGDVDAIALFEMGIACAAALAAMFVVGVFSESIRGLFRSSEEEVSAVSKGSSPAGSHNAEGSVPRGEITAASDTQNDGVELGPGSSSTAACVPQEAVDGVVPPVCSEETSARPTVSLASSSVSRGDDEGLTRSMESVMGPVGVSVPVESSSGSGSVAVSKQLMSAAVSGVVAGVCFSIATRLFNRR